MNTKVLYIHVPFSEHIASKLDQKQSNKVYAHDSSLIRQYIKEIEDIPVKLDTVYIGGATPHRLDHKLLRNLFEVLSSKLSDNYELSIEINPRYIDEETIGLLSRQGINRVCLSIQQEEDNPFTDISKLYDFKDTVSLLHKYGIFNISFDILFGLPNQTLKMFEDTLQNLCNLDPKHITLYEYESDDDSYNESAYDQYISACTILENHGFNQYEVSSFSKEGFVSRYNLSNYKYEDTYGIGPDASYKLDHFRYINTNDIENYLKGQRLSETIELDSKTEISEYIFMNLHLKEGLMFKEFTKKHKIDDLEIFKEEIQSSIEEDLLVQDGTGLRASPYGFKNINDLLMNFID